MQATWAECTEGDQGGIPLCSGMGREASSSSSGTWGAWAAEEVGAYGTLHPALPLARPPPSQPPAAASNRPQLITAGLACPEVSWPPNPPLGPHLCNSPRSRCPAAAEKPAWSAAGAESLARSRGRLGVYPRAGLRARLGVGRPGGLRTTWATLFLPPSLPPSLSPPPSLSHPSLSFFLFFSQAARFRSWQFCRGDPTRAPGFGAQKSLGDV